MLPADVVEDAGKLPWNVSHSICVLSNTQDWNWPTPVFVSVSCVEERL